MWRFVPLWCPLIFYPLPPVQVMKCRSHAITSFTAFANPGTKHANYWSCCKLQPPATLLVSYTDEMYFTV